MHNTGHYSAFKSVGFEVSSVKAAYRKSPRIMCTAPMATKAE